MHHVPFQTIRNFLSNSGLVFFFFPTLYQLCPFGTVLETPTSVIRRPTWKGKKRPNPRTLSPFIIVYLYFTVDDTTQNLAIQKQKKEKMGACIVLV